MKQSTLPPIGILVLGCAYALSLTPRILASVGGLTVAVMCSLFGVFLLKVDKDRVSFRDSITHMVSANGGMMLLLGIYYLMVFVAALRAGFEWLSDSHVVKTHIINLFDMAVGFFIMANKRYQKPFIYCSLPFLLLHTFFLQEFVALTGESARAGLSEGEFALGVTTLWQYFAMIVLVVLGNLLDERKTTIKVILALLLVPLYRAVLLCGFATPLALFLIGHATVGVFILRYGRHGHSKLLIKFVLASILLAASTGTFFKLTHVTEGDKRFKDVQVRFKNLRENWRGGGYDYDTQDSRLELLFKSLDDFKRSPFFGVGGIYGTLKHTSGGHQAFFDYLSLYGLAGQAPFVLFVLLGLRNAIKRYRQERTWLTAFQASIVFVFFVGGLVNPVWTGGPLTAMFAYAYPFALSPAIRNRQSRMGRGSLAVGQVNYSDSRRDIGMCYK